MEKAHSSDRRRDLRTAADFGGRVHVSTNALLWTWLAKFSTPGIRRIEAIRLARMIYRELLTWMLAAEFPRERQSYVTRMGDTLTGIGVCFNVPVTVVDIIRAGMEPSFVCRDLLLESDVIDESLVHLHHITTERMTDTAGHVINIRFDDSKADEPVKPGSIVVLPDPAFASGRTVDTTLSRYETKYPGMVAKFIVVAMVATPFGIERVMANHSNAVLFAGRIDPELDEKSYIHPGVGGVGEIFNGTKR